MNTLEEVKERFAGEMMALEARYLPTAERVSERRAAEYLRISSAIHAVRREIITVDIEDLAGIKVDAFDNALGSFIEILASNHLDSRVVAEIMALVTRFFMLAEECLQQNDRAYGKGSPRSPEALDEEGIATYMNIIGMAIKSHNELNPECPISIKNIRQIGTRKNYEPNSLPPDFKLRLRAALFTVRALLEKCGDKALEVGSRRKVPREKIEELMDSEEERQLAVEAMARIFPKIHRTSLSRFMGNMGERPTSSRQGFREIHWPQGVAHYKVGGRTIGSMIRASPRTPRSFLARIFLSQLFLLSNILPHCQSRGRPPQLHPARHLLPVPLRREPCR